MLITEKEVWPEQQLAIEAQRRHFGRLIAFHKDHWPFEYTYWQDRGWW